MNHADLTSWRKTNGLSKTNAARHLGISRRALFNYEGDRRRIPRAVQLACQAPVDYDALGLEPVVSYRRKAKEESK